MRMSLRCICLFILCLFFFGGCIEEEETNDEGEIMVEGWIEDGEFPIVIVTHTIPVKSNASFSLKQDSLIKYVARDAKVTISNRNECVVLTSRNKREYFPPYIYNTGRMRGKAGESYHLRVEWNGKVCEADCTIPNSPRIKSIECEEIKKDRFLIKAELEDSVNKNFASFVQVDSVDNVRHLSRLSLTDYEREITIDRSSSEDKYFKSGDKVRLYVVSMEEQMYSFWQEYDKLSSFSKNPLCPYTKNLKGNIKGGIGYWAGYGLCRKVLIVR